VRLRSLIKIALNEDMPRGDLTTDPLKIAKKIGFAQLVAKQDMVLSGTEVFEGTFKAVDHKVTIKWFKTDGDKVTEGTEICVIRGPIPSLLKAERTALNFLGHLSGIATSTSQFVREVEGTNTKIIDTRKTIAGLRDLEKAAVVHGGGINHRMNLSDGVLIKENHIRAAGSISAAVEKIREKLKNSSIEVEVTSPSEIDEALRCGVERLLLDNMNNLEIAQAVKQIKKRAIIEASGNMTLDRVKSIARLGVHFISVGSITHSAPHADVSLLFKRGTL